MRLTMPSFRGDAPAPRVLYVAPSAELYGSDLALERMAKAHLTRGGRAVVLLPRAGPLAPRLRAAHVDVRIVPLAVLQRRLMNPGGVMHISADLLRSLRPVLATARELKPDLLHSNTSSVVSGAAAARVLRLPHVWTLREDLRMRGGGVPARLLRLGADQVIAVSGSTRDQLLRRCPGLSSRVTVVRDGVDVERFANLPPREQACGRLGIDPGRPVIGMLARIKANKGQTLLVEAVRRIETARETVQLVFAGDVVPGEEYELTRLEDAIRSAGMTGRVTLPGFVTDPTDLLAACHIVAAPSIAAESFGLAAVDGLSAGKPVVASAIGGHLEIVRDGIDGFLVRPGDVDALAAALDRLLGDALLRRRLGEAAFRDRARFSAEHGHQAVWRVYDEVLNRRR